MTIINKVGAARLYYADVMKLCATIGLLSRPGRGFGRYVRATGPRLWSLRAGRRAAGDLPPAAEPLLTRP